MTTIPMNAEHLEAAIATEEAKAESFRTEIESLDTQISALKSKHEELLAENQRLQAAKVAFDKRVMSELAKHGIRLGLDASLNAPTFTDKVLAATAIEQLDPKNP
jgi:chromosome segregation ATPase